MTGKIAFAGIDKSEIVEIILRMIAGGLTVGLLIVLPMLQILGVA